MGPTGNIWWLAVHQQLPDVVDTLPVYQLSSSPQSLFLEGAPSRLKSGVGAVAAMEALAAPVAVVAMRQFH
jgi:hypothetical protein